MDDAQPEQTTNGTKSDQLLNVKRISRVPDRTVSDAAMGKLLDQNADNDGGEEPERKNKVESSDVAFSEEL